MSPVTVKKVDGYRVSSPTSIHAKNTTRAKAKAQKRLLNAVEHTNWRPTGRRATSRGTSFSTEIAKQEVERGRGMPLRHAGRRPKVAAYKRLKKKDIFKAQRTT